MPPVSFNIIEERVKTWLNTKYPEITIESINMLSGGQTNLCYRINQDYVLKVYLSKQSEKSGRELRYFRNGTLLSQQFNDSGFIPRIYGVYENDEILEANALLMEYIEGKELSRILHYSNGRNRQKIGRKIGTILKYLHSSQILSNQLYDTEQLREKVITRLWKANKIGSMDKEISRFASKFVEKYESKDILTDFVVIHNDAHLENFIITPSKSLRLIDFDMLQSGPAFLEMRMILHSCLMPGNLVARDIKSEYDNLLLLEILKGILKTYPQICPMQYLEEVKMLAMSEILAMFNLPKSCADYEVARKRGKLMFDAIFKSNLLEDFINDAKKSISN
jgi:thiamine kinase-like enzyme